MTDHSDLPDGFRPNDPTARDRAETHRARVVFTIAEYGDGTPWIMLKPREQTLPVLQRGDGFLGLEFRNGVTMEEAQRFVEEMRRMLTAVTHTHFLT